MLKQLLIKNYALIEHLELAPVQGLNIITGETGAGKSIMLGAIGLLMGARADAKALWDPEQKCVVEGVFQVEDEKLKAVFDELDLDYQAETVIRREITSSKSRAFVNDSPATLDALKTLGNYLVDIHSQHDSRLIGSAAYQLSLLDLLANTKEDLANYQATWQVWQRKQQVLDQFVATAQQARQQLDFNQYQLQELLRANLVAGEEEELTQELELLDHAEDVSARMATAIQVLEGGEDAPSILSQLKTASQALDKIRHLAPAIESQASRLTSSYEELRDVLRELQSSADAFEPNPSRQEELNTRLSLLDKLKKKHQIATVEELLQLQASLQKAVDAVENQDAELEALKLEVQKLKQQATDQALALRNKRLAHLPELEADLSESLTRVAMPMARLAFTLDECALNATGMDQASIQFSANKGMPLRPISQVASGGEFSRVMLCIKYQLARFTSLPTLIFDEIDTGISGEVALQVAQMVKQMAATHQLLVITHLPQMAAQGSSHFYVFKDHSKERTTSGMRQLTHQERVKELAQMMSGNAESASALQSAEELLLAVNG